MFATLANTVIPPLALDLLFILAAAAIVATIFRRFRLEAIPGYLIAGALIGPGALGLISREETVDQVSQLAIILLMFGIGMQLDTAAIKRGLVHVLGVALASCVVVTLAVWGVTSLAGIPAPAGLVIAMAVSISSTAILVRVLMARREVRTPHGRLALGVSIVQDLVTVAIMAALPPIQRWAGTGTLPGADPADPLPAWASLIFKSMFSVGGAVVMIAVGAFVLPRLLKMVARAGSNELMLVVSAAIALGAAVGTRYLGFSAEMGAFLAGFLLAGTPFRYQLSGQIAPMRDLLMAVFFTAVGLGINLSAVADDWWIILLAAGALFAAKAVITSFIAWAAGIPVMPSVVAGVYLANAGEFSLVVLAAAAAAGIVSGPLYAGALAVVALTLIVSPSLMDLSHRLADRLASLPMAPWLKSTATAESPGNPHSGGGALPIPDPTQPTLPATSDTASAADEPPIPVGPNPVPPIVKHVIIAGFGPVGRTLADRFAVLDIPFTVIELNAVTVQRQATLGRNVIYGDAANPDVLESAGIGHADAIILTFPDDEATLRACRVCRAVAPDILIAARTNFLSGKFIAQQLGADVVTVEEIATAQAMERDVLIHLRRHLAKRDGYHLDHPEAHPGHHPGADSAH